MERSRHRPIRAFLATALLATTVAAAAPPPADLSAQASSQVGGSPALDARSSQSGAVSPPAPQTPSTAPVLDSPRSADAGEVRFAELPNFHRVDDNLYRGGQPRAGGLARLKAVGVRTVLNLRYERKQSAAEETAARAEGLRYFNIPMYGLARPEEAQIARALALIDDPENRPVFVHCERGSDRTGAVVACYRIAPAKWTAKQAIDEAMGFGMYRIEVAKRSFIRDFYGRTAG